MGINERKEKQRVELKQHILDASIKLLAEKGYDGVSIRKIAEIVQYSPTTIYLYFKDKGEILFELHEIGFRKMEEFNNGINDIKNPLIRLHKLGENYIHFGLANPEYYDLMFIIPEPIDFLNKKELMKGRWDGGDNALNILKATLQECQDKKMIKPGEINAIAMGIWGMVHGLVSLCTKKRCQKLMDEKDIIPTMHKSLNWIINAIDITS